jgi:hypothetical protein
MMLSDRLGVPTASLGRRSTPRTSTSSEFSAAIAACSGTGSSAVFSTDIMVDPGTPSVGAPADRASSAPAVGSLISERLPAPKKIPA